MRNEDFFGKNLANSNSDPELAGLSGPEGKRGKKGKGQPAPNEEALNARMNDFIRRGVVVKLRVDLATARRLFGLDPGD